MYTLFKAIYVVVGLINMLIIPSTETADDFSVSVIALNPLTNSSRHVINSVNYVICPFVFPFCLKLSAVVFKIQKP